MKKLLVFLVLIPAAWSLVAQKAVSVNFAPAPLFFEGKQDLMAEGNYEIGISKHSSLRSGLGLGFRNTTEFVEKSGETAEKIEKYAVVCGILSWKYYPFCRAAAKNGLYGGLLVQLGCMSLKNETRTLSVTSGSSGLYTFVKAGLIGGFTLFATKRLLLEPELGYLPGKKFGVLSKSETLKNRLHLALNIGLRF